MRFLSSCMSALLPGFAMIKICKPQGPYGIDLLFLFYTFSPLSFHLPFDLVFRGVKFPGLCCLCYGFCSSRKGSWLVCLLSIDTLCFELFFFSLFFFLANGEKKGLGLFSFFLNSLTYSDTLFSFILPFLCPPLQTFFRRSIMA